MAGDCCARRPKARAGPFPRAWRNGKIRVFEPPLVGGPHGRRMHLPPNPVSIDRHAPHRPRLPLSLVPTRDRYSPCAQCPLRGGSSRAHRGRARDHRDAIGKRKRPEDRALPHLQGCCLEQLPAGRAHCPLRAGWHARWSRSMPSRHPHIHVVEAALGYAPAGRQGRAGILWPRRRLAAGEPGAATNHERGPAGPVVIQMQNFCFKPAALKPLRNAATRLTLGSGEPDCKNPITGIADCCARAASGQAATAPPSSVMNWRRFMSSMGTSSPMHYQSRRLAVLSPPQLQPATGRPASPWGKAEMLSSARAWGCHSRILDR